MRQQSLKLGVGFIGLMAAGALGAPAAAHTLELGATRHNLFFADADERGSADTAPPVPKPELVAQTAPLPAIQTTKTVSEDDGLGEDGAYITADEVETTEDNVLIARGKVEMRYEGRLIRADEVRYDQNTGRTIAIGNTQTINADGSVQYADRLEFDDSEGTGEGLRIASVDADNSKLFANRVEQVDKDTTRLTEVIFTPCELCVKDNVTQEPTWSIQASEIKQDRKRRMVIYRNAVFKARGVPVFYAPVLWHADPGAKRASGFLMPKVGTSKRRGASLELPYYWAVSPYTEVIISPKFSQKVNPLLNLEANRKFYSGQLNSRFGFTQDAFFDNNSDKGGESLSRGYLLADGAFKINPDWRWSFTAQRVFDDNNANFFERYKIDDGFPKVGDYVGNSRQLTSQINLNRQTDSSFFGVSLISFQSLQIASQSLIPGTTIRRPVAVNDDTLPVVAPMIEAHWAPSQTIFGGRATFAATGVSILRRRKPSADIGLGAQGPVDSARLSLEASWRRDMITPIGLKIAPFLDLRHDQYRISDYDADANTDDNYDISRSISTAGIDLSYPLIRKFKGFTTIIEPIAQIAISPDSKLSPYLTNEDSQSFEFDHTTLFKANKSPGFDLYEGGERLSLGLKTQVITDGGLKVSTLLGRTFRAEPETSYLQTIPGTSYVYDPSGLSGTKSDWVVQADVRSPAGIYGFTRLRLDSDTGSIRRGEAGFSVIRNETRATVRYIVDNTRATVIGGEFFDDQTRYQNLQFSGQHFFNAKWGVSGRVERDMLREVWVRSEVGLIYRDDCTRIDLLYQRDETAIALYNGEASSSISIRISLATLTTSDADFSDIR